MSVMIGGSAYNEKDQRILNKMWRWKRCVYVLDKTKASPRSVFAGGALRVAQKSKRAVDLLRIGRKHLQQLPEFRRQCDNLIKLGDLYEPFVALTAALIENAEISSTPGMAMVPIAELAMLKARIEHIDTGAKGMVEQRQRNPL